MNAPNADRRDAPKHPELELLAGRDRHRPIVIEDHRRDHDVQHESDRAISFR